MRIVRLYNSPKTMYVLLFVFGILSIIKTKYICHQI